MTSNRTMTPAQWALLGVLSTLWGGSFFFVDLALRQLPPLCLVAWRVAAGAALLYGVLRGQGGAMPRDAHTWRSLLVMGLLNNVVPFSLFTWSQTHIASGLASILNATTPLWTVLVAHFCTRDEKATPARLAGVALGFAGVAVSVGGAASQDFGSSTIAEGACLVATLSYALAGVYGRRLRALGIAPLQAATGQLASAALVLVPVALAVDRPWQLASLDATTWGALAGLAALSTALAFVIYFRLLAAAGATNLLLVTFLIPVTAILLGSFILGETLAARHWLGFALIATGLVAIDGRLLRTRHTARDAGVLKPHFPPAGDSRLVQPAPSSRRQRLRRR
ncbi:MAG TPA: EamA family transporter [Casimicrobiaceae bacterium]